MIGTLLEDIVSGLPFEAISRRFAEKMHPLQYQRPQAPPSSGNIAQAEKVIQQLAAAGSLARRFARLEDVQTIWKPLQAKEESTQGDGIFSHLKPKGASADVQGVRIPPATMTWDKFARIILPDVERIEFLVPAGSDNYSALVTAANPDSPPIIQWDSEEKRNPVSWYVYHGGSSPDRWGLVAGVYHDVTGICFQPSMWDPDKNFTHHGESVFFLLDGARDSRSEHSGLALFPEILKSEFHGIRSTIEAFSRNGIMDGEDEASACGIRLQKGAVWNLVFRVISKGAQVVYKLDRWD
jgi:hypothetical protein